MKKQMRDPGPDPDEPGAQDATVMDFLLPLLGGGAARGAAAAAPVMRKAVPAVADDAYGTAMRDMIKRSMSEPAPAFAHGGVVDDFRLDDPYSVNGGASATAKAPPIPPPPPQIAAAPDLPQPPAPKPAPVAAPAALEQKAVNPRPLPGMPADVTPDELRGYLDKQRSAINRYGPDEQYDREMQILKSRTGLGPTLARAAATFAGPEYVKAQDEQWDRLLQGSAGAMERAREGTMKQVSANRQIDFMDPGSTMSKLYQQTFMPIFREMGYKPEDIANMPAGQIGTIAELGIKHEDAQTALLLKKAMLGVQEMTAKGNIANQQAQRQEQAAKTRREAASEILKRSGNAKVLGIPIPFTSDVSGEEEDAARRVLSEQMNEGLEFGSEEEAEAANLPPGTEITINGRRARVS